MKSARRYLIVLTALISLIAFSNNLSIAQNKETNLEERKAMTGGGGTSGVVDSACACLEPGNKAILKAYGSLEEDEWPKAIVESKNAIETINNLAKTCKCPEVDTYKKVADSFLKYAQGGNHLDGADEPNCPFALKVYGEAISGLTEAIPKITNKDVKDNVKNILEYAQEEQQFVKDECQEEKKS
ncbi:MAG: hypothetical protein A3B68_02930 [Candidatus Melainabacteria bacterium RIFCSPHIGHO2_02_FULL_34_12]|nr:MAG: hypothetical protein A3B68_02930 [Candidatus Melainabacteria bacterium RIFCSPHIGHO2_02_FULL_34_12]